MPSVKLPVHSYDDPSISTGRLVNVYAEQAADGKGPVTLQGVPGIAPFATLGAGPGGGMYVQRGVLYAVSGEVLYRIDEFGSESQLGNIPGSTRCTFAGNGVEIVITRGGPDKFIYSGGTVTQIVDGDFPPVLGVAAIDGYVVWTETASGVWGCSKLYDGATYDALDFAVADTHQDDLICPPIIDHRQVLLAGQESIEVWWNSGPPASDPAGFPFDRLAGGGFEIGCLARYGYAKQDNSVEFLASDRTIRRISQQTPLRVSQHGMEKKMASYSRLDDCSAFPFSWNGHLFTVWRFPTAQATWVHDITTNEWHERQTFGGSTWDVIDSASCYGKVFVQNATTGAIGFLSDSCYQEFGGTLRRSWQYPQVYSTNRAMVHGQFELVMRTGDAPIGTIPHVGLDISDDGGNTWTSLPSRELGRVGQYEHVIRWNRLGQARDRVYRCWVDDAAVPVRITDTTLTVE